MPLPLPLPCCNHIQPVEGTETLVNVHLVLCLQVATTSSPLRVLKLFGIGAIVYVAIGCNHIQPVEGTETLKLGFGTVFKRLQPHPAR